MVSDTQKKSRFTVCITAMKKAIKMRGDVGYTGKQAQVAFSMTLLYNYVFL